MGAVWLFTEIEKLFRTFAIERSAAFASYVLPIVSVGLTIYIIILGMQIARGAIQNPTQDFVWKMFRASVICAFIVGSGLYGDYVIAGFEGLRNELAAVAAKGTSFYEVVDDISFELTTAGKKHVDVAQNSGVFINIPRYIAAACFWVMKLCILFFAALPLLLSYAYFYMALAFGPLAFACLLFPVTAKYFESWLATIITALFTYVVVSAIIALALVVLKNLIAAGNKELGLGSGFDFLTAAINQVVMFVVICYLAWKASELAASIVGGSSNSFDTRVATRIASALVGGLGGVGKGANKAKRGAAPNNQLENKT